MTGVVSFDITASCDMFIVQGLSNLVQDVIDDVLRNPGTHSFPALIQHALMQTNNRVVNTEV